MGGCVGPDGKKVTCEGARCERVRKSSRVHSARSLGLETTGKYITRNPDITPRAHCVCVCVCVTALGMQLAIYTISHSNQQQQREALINVCINCVLYTV